MSFTKVKAFNLALSNLLLSRQVSDTETDTTTNEVRVLRLHWDDALTSALADLDLDTTAEQKSLELITELTEGPWKYVYRYPQYCVLFRKIVSCAVKDTSDTFIPKQVGVYNGEKVIFTNQYAAKGEFISSNLSLALLNSHAGQAVALKLAILSAPLNVGKGAKTLKESLEIQYRVAINEARNLDKLENYTYDDPRISSEYVAARMG